VTGPSSGISTAFEDCLAEDARVDLVVPVLDFRAVDVVEARGVRVEGRPGIFAVSLLGCRIVRSCHQCVGVVVYSPPRRNDSVEPAGI
jgi:hypothetical protein